MKTKLFMAAMIVLVGTTAFANGPGDPRVAIIGQKSPGTFKVIYEGEKVGNVKMTIYNQSSQLVFAETVKEVDSFSRNVNFTGMEYGEYTIVIKDGNGRRSTTVSYENTASSVRNVMVTKAAERGKYLLAVSNIGEEQITVRIFDGDSNLVHNQDMTIKGSLRVVYNLSDVAGVPTFEVTDGTGNIKTIKY